jgi:O-antigen ligase
MASENRALLAGKKHKKKSSGITIPAVERSSSPIKAQPSSQGRDWQAQLMYGLFFFMLFLACSPELDSKFSLPKLLVLGLGVFTFSLLAIARRSKAPALLLPALALGGWWIVSTPFALHVPTALNGEYDCNNGLWTHLCCLSLFVASAMIPRDTQSVGRIIALLVAAIVPVAAINIMEATGLSAIGLKEVSTLGDRVAASALMNFAIPFVVIALVRARHWGIKAGLGCLLAVFLYSEFLSWGRGAWAGLVVAMLVVLFGMSHSKARWRALLMPLAGMPLLAVLAAWLNPGVAERFASLTRLAQDEALSQRFIYYRAALRALLEHPVTGIGFENFRNSYPSYRAAEDINFFKDIIPTMVHNGYLEIALNNGIPALLLYLALVVGVLYRLGRQLSRDAGQSDLPLGMLAALSAYLVQDLSGWLTLGLAPVFWIMLGLAVNQTAELGPPNAKRLVAGYFGAMLVLSLYLLGNGYFRLIADARLFEAQALAAGARWGDAEILVGQALSSHPADSRSEMIAGQIYSQRYLSSHDPLAYAKSRELLEVSYNHNRFERMRLINIVALETLAFELGQLSAPSDFARMALTVLSKTDNDNPDFHEFKAKYFAVQGRFVEALDAIREARRQAPQEQRFRVREAEYQSRIDG